MGTEHHGASQPELNALALHFHAEREHLLQAWRELAQRDPELTARPKLPREALDDHIPAILTNLERRLRMEDTPRATAVELEHRESAAEHALQRWQHGYDLREALREWGHLLEVLLTELESYAGQHAEIDSVTRAVARRIITRLCTEGLCESAARYMRLLQQDASNRLGELEESLNTLQALEDRRAALLKQTAHDLRGSVGVLAGASAVLGQSDITNEQRAQFFWILRRGINSVAAQMTEFVELARLESGLDQPSFQTIDVSERLRETCGLLQPQAEQKGLYLKCEGPGDLRVTTDPLRVQRILQNLLLNSLKATEQGGILVRWGRNGRHWSLSVQDTGRGFDPQRLAVHVRAPRPKAAVSTAGQPPQSAQGALPPTGEGIGLSIIRRLCHMLRGHLEIDSAPGRGTTTHILFPLG